MSYFICDKSDYLGDVASNSGLAELREGKETPPALKQFIEKGEGDKALCLKIIEETKGIPSLKHWAEAMQMADEFPVILTDGVGSD